MTVAKETFTTAQLIAKAIKEEDICRVLIEKIIPERTVNEVKVIKNSKSKEYPMAEEPITAAHFNVKFEDDNKWCDVRIKMVAGSLDPKKIRLDVSSYEIENLAETGFYREEKPLYAIFICMEDPFEQGVPVYSFQWHDMKKGVKMIEDKSCIIVINLKCDEEKITEELKPLYRFLLYGESGEIIL